MSGYCMSRVETWMLWLCCVSNIDAECAVVSVVLIGVMFVFDACSALCIAEMIFEDVVLSVPLPCLL